MTATILTEEEFDRFVNLIYRVSGIRIPRTKKLLVSNRIRRRVNATGTHSFARYYQLLTSAAGSREMPNFLDEITTNETFFFRDVHQYDWFSDVFLPEIAQQARRGQRSRSLRIWSAAASNGSELYSLAIRLLEKKVLFAGWNLSLLGTDLSVLALNAAKAGLFDVRTLRLVEPDIRRRYFDETSAGQFAIKPEVRNMVAWKPHNLLQMLPGEPFDLVVLKNVLIYFDADSKAVVASHITRSVARDGYLVLGPTEVMSSLLGGLNRCQTWLYQKIS